MARLALLCAFICAVPAGAAPIHDAARCGAIEKLAELLSNSAQVDAIDDDGMAPIHHVASLGYVDAVELLLRCGADIELRGPQGWRALHMAASWGYTDTVAILLEWGADASAVDDHGFTPYDWAHKRNHRGAAVLLHSAQLNDAAARGDAEAIQQLARKPYPVCTVDAEGWTPLHFAVAAGRAGAIRALLAAKHRGNASDIKGTTPVHLAAERGDAEVLRLILEGGSSAEARDDANVSPLHIAALTGNADVVRILIGNRAPTDGQTLHHATPLDWAAWTGQQPTSSALASAGARRAAGFSPPETGAGPPGLQTALVVEVTDGDTLLVLIDGHPRRLRLDGIDAPEAHQAQGRESKACATSLAYGRLVGLRVADTDRYGRLVAEVILPDGRSLNEEMVRSGHAWWYWRYAPDNEKLASLAAGAYAAKCGLWAHANPCPPWEYRESKRASVYTQLAATSSQPGTVTSPPPRTRQPSPSVASGPVGGPVHVKGYYRKDGTYVRPHTRSRPRR